MALRVRSGRLRHISPENLTDFTQHGRLRIRTNQKGCESFVPVQSLEDKNLQQQQHQSFMYLTKTNMPSSFGRAARTRQEIGPVPSHYYWGICSHPSLPLIQAADSCLQSRPGKAGKTLLSAAACCCCRALPVWSAASPFRLSYYRTSSSPFWSSNWQRRRAISQNPELQSLERKGQAAAAPTAATAAAASLSSPASRRESCRGRPLNTSGAKTN